MRIVLIKPKPGCRVLDVTAQPPVPLPAEGKELQDGAYWRRRERMGDVEISEISDGKPVKKGK